MLFLYRPPQTRIPFAVPRGRSEQAAYNRQLQAKFESTRRVRPTPPATIDREAVTVLKDLGALHQSGVLTDAEFEAAKARVLAQ